MRGDKPSRQASARLTARQIAQATAEALVVSAMGITHVAAKLRPSGRNLWPAPGTGNYYPKLEPHHAACMMLAAKCGEPVDAVETVDRYGSLRVEHIVHTNNSQHEAYENYLGQLDKVVHLGSIPVAPTLVETMTAYVAMFAQADRLAKPLVTVEVQIDDPVPEATILIVDGWLCQSVRQPAVDC